MHEMVMDLYFIGKMIDLNSFFLGNYDGFLGNSCDLSLEMGDQPQIIVLRASIFSVAASFY